MTGQHCQHPYALLDKTCEVATFAAFVTCAAGCISSLVHSFRPGWWGSHFAGFWICVFGGVLAVQAFQLYKKPHLSTLSGSRYWLWLCYHCYMTVVAVLLVVCYALVPSPTAGSTSPNGWWAFTWLPSIALSLVYLRLHQQRAIVEPLAEQQQQQHDQKQQQGQQKSETSAAAVGPVLQVVAGSQKEDAMVEASATQGVVAALASSGSTWHQHCRHTWQRLRVWCQGVLRVLGWSSIFWAVSLGYFLALQAAWLAADQQRFPALKYGQLVQVPIDNTDLTAQLFIRCVGPITPGLSTFVLMSGAGAPAASLFGLQDQLAAGGRRSCSYDRLGSGWSDEIITPAHLKRIPYTLHSLLAAAGVSPPFVLVGHSLGGQLALQYASLYPQQVSGLALLDSYSSTAINLQQDVIANSTDDWGNVRYTFTKSIFMPAVLSAINLARVVSPLGWTRFMMHHRSSYKYQPEMNALYGTDKAWQGQWGEYAALMEALPDSLDEQLTLSAPHNGESFWWGTGWKDFSPLPVIVMPARDTLSSLGSTCDLLQAACQSSVMQADKQYYAKQVLGYVATLSSNASLAVMLGSHAFPWAAPTTAAVALLAKFAST